MFSRAIIKSNFQEKSCQISPKIKCEGFESDHFKAHNTPPPHLKHALSSMDQSNQVGRCILKAKQQHERPGSPSIQMAYACIIYKQKHTKHNLIHMYSMIIFFPHWRSGNSTGSRLKSLPEAKMLPEAKWL